jgi:hypothetical protein
MFFKTEQDHLARSDERRIQQPFSFAMPAKNEQLIFSIKLPLKMLELFKEVIE